MPDGPKKLNTAIKGVTAAGDVESFRVGPNGELMTSNSGADAANVPEIQTDTTALAANADRRGWQIQNVGTNPLFVRLGADASSALFHAVLRGGSTDSDGLGASWAQMSGVVYTGVVSVAGTSPKYVVTEV